MRLSKDDSATPAAVNETECPSSMLFCLLGFPGVATPSVNWGDKAWDNVFATGESDHCNSAISIVRVIEWIQEVFILTKHSFLEMI